MGVFKDLEVMVEDYCNAHYPDNETTKAILLDEIGGFVNGIYQIGELSPIAKELIDSWEDYELAFKDGA
jgi:hypothetical protein